MNCKLLSGLALLCLTNGSALADKPSYCAAYAQDFANAQGKNKENWQHKYEIALQSCLENPTMDRSGSAPQAKKKSKTNMAPIRSAEEIPPEPKIATTKIKPEPGSNDWNAYCAKKYASFNIKTGMYHSLTGVDHKCVVTNP